MIFHVIFRYHSKVMCDENVEGLSDNDKTLSISTESDEEDIRNDINNDSVKKTYPFLPKTHNWKQHEKFVKKRQRYMNVRDSYAYNNLLKKNKINFKPANVTKITLRDTIIIYVEKLLNRNIDK